MAQCQWALECLRFNLALFASVSESQPCLVRAGGNSPGGSVTTCSFMMADLTRFWQAGSPKLNYSASSLSETSNGRHLTPSWILSPQRLAKSRHNLNCLIWSHRDSQPRLAEATRSHGHRAFALMKKSGGCDASLSALHSLNLAF